jgi:hypothetical protein
MSWRRFTLILNHLPPESAYKTALLNDTDLTSLPDPEPGVYGPWPQTDLLLARMGDLMQHWIWMNADEKTRPKQPPRPYPRPGVELSNVRPISPEALAYLEYLRTHHGEAPPDDWAPEVG